MWISAYYAKIKFIDDNLKKIVEARDILEFEDTSAEELINFDKNKVYTLPWEDGKETKNLAIQVAAIECKYHHIFHFCRIA